jgi:ATP-dependent helicase YprA (DUF1998 family)
MGANALKILKRDAVGRVSYRAEQREAILEEFERSGLKGAALAVTVPVTLEIGLGVRASLMRLC